EVTTWDEDSDGDIDYVYAGDLRGNLWRFDVTSDTPAQWKVSFGTDTSPHNILEEMRTAAVLARIAAEDIDTVSTADLLHAATVGGARALGRNDIGRLEPGCRADLVLVDLADPGMVPARDPLRSLVYTAAERAVRDVYVGGEQVVADRKVLTLDRAGAAGRLAEAQARMLRDAPNHDYAGRSAEAIVPLSLPLA
ncbi:MAG: PilC/PilY family type IV pilus protein, partial [Alphaproteobacteria bacterium]